MRQPMTMGEATLAPQANPLAMRARAPRRG